MSVYGKRAQEMEQKQALRKHQDVNLKTLTHEEKEALRLKMQQNAAIHDAQKQATYGDNITEDAESNSKVKAKFIKDMAKDVYMEDNIGLEERLNRRKHYQQRGATRDE